MDGDVSSRGVDGGWAGADVRSPPPWVLFPLSFPPLLVDGRGGDGSSVEGAGGATDGKDELREVLDGRGEAGDRVGLAEEFLEGGLFGGADDLLGEAVGGVGDEDPDMGAADLGDVDSDGLGDRGLDGLEDGAADTAKPVGGLGEGFFEDASLGDAFPVGVCRGDALEEGEADPLEAGSGERGSARTRVRATASLRFVFFASTTARKENVPLAVRGALTTRRSARLDLMSPSSHRTH